MPNHKRTPNVRPRCQSHSFHDFLAIDTHAPPNSTDHQARIVVAQQLQVRRDKVAKRVIMPLPVPQQAVPVDSLADMTSLSNGCCLKFFSVQGSIIGPAQVLICVT